MSVANKEKYLKSLGRTYEGMDEQPKVNYTLNKLNKVISEHNKETSFTFYKLILFIYSRNLEDEDNEEDNLKSVTEFQNWNKSVMDTIISCLFPIFGLLINTNELAQKIITNTYFDEKSQEIIIILKVPNNIDLQDKKNFIDLVKYNYSDDFAGDTWREEFIFLDKAEKWLVEIEFVSINVL